MESAWDNLSIDIRDTVMAMNKSNIASSCQVNEYDMADTHSALVDAWVRGAAPETAEEAADVDMNDVSGSDFCF